MAKKAAAKKVARKATGKGKASVPADLQTKLAELAAKEKKQLEQLAGERAELLKAHIAAKQEAVAAAKAAATAANRKVAELEAELDDLKVEAGLSRGRKGGRTASGRKQRVSTETKRQYVEQALEKYSKGVSFSDLRAHLLGVVDPATKGSIFAPQDFNSSSKFGQKLLPKGWKVVGERRDAKVMPK